MEIKRRQFRIGYLFFKYILDSPLMEDKRVNTGEKLSTVLEKMGIIRLEGAHTEWDGRRDHWYSYNAGMEHSEPKIIKLVVQYLEEAA